MSENQLPRVDCPFCEWRGPNNRYPHHLAECSKKTDADDSRVGTAILADGGRFDPTPGALVVDRDDDSAQPSVALVLERSYLPAERHTINDLGGQTVADANPDYPADADVVTVAFVDDLDDVVSDYREYTTTRLREHARAGDIRTCSYPAPRLKPAEGRDSVAKPGGEA